MAKYHGLSEVESKNTETLVKVSLELTWLNLKGLTYNQIERNIVIVEVFNLDAMYASKHTKGLTSYYQIERNISIIKFGLK